MKLGISKSIEKNNLDIYFDEKVVLGYSKWKEYSEAEILALQFIQEEKRHILDIGCGAGRHAEFFKEMEKEYLGIDVSQPMIESARNRFPEMKFILMDALLMNSNDYKFDAILFMHNGLDVLYPYKRRKLMLEKIRDMLNPKGVFIFSSHIPDWNRKFNEFPNGLFNRLCRFKERVVFSQKAYLPERYRNKRIWQFRSTPLEIQRELMKSDLQIKAIFPDYSKTPIDWYYYVAIRL